MSSAGLLVQAESTGRYLFLFQESRGTWESSGGHSEGDETSLATAMREFQEETRYPGKTVTVIYPAECLRSFCLYLGRVPHQFRPVLSHEHSAFSWAYLDEAPRPLHPGLSKLIRRFGHAV